MPSNGAVNAEAAMFLYRADDRVQVAWDTAVDVQRRDSEGGNRVLELQGRKAENSAFLRIDMHPDKASFLSALASWNATQRQFLLVYAHGAVRSSGAVGILPSPTTDSEQLITWEELAAAMPCGVVGMWLIGCQCADVVRHWSGPHPVNGWMISCSDSRDFQPPVDEFHREISLETILPPASVLHQIHERLPDLANSIQMVCRREGAWVPVRPEPPPATLSESELALLPDLFG